MVPVNLLKLISYDLLLLYVVCPVKVNNTIVVYVMYDSFVLIFIDVVHIVFFV